MLEIQSFEVALLALLVFDYFLTFNDEVTESRGPMTQE